jgi:hypothetical protein
VDYERIARLGRGGMGVVDLARDPDGNNVALKRLTLHGSASEIMQARQRLLREAKVLRRLRHPNIVRLLDVVEEDDEIVLVMPYLPGGSLADRVAQHGPAPPAEVERLGQRLLGALAEAHAAGIIHRDLKPANVLYDADGEPQLADFGLAFTWDQSQPLTMAGMVVGTPGFIAPEQARGEPLTPSSDIFSLGATLLFAATGGGPFGNGDPALLMVRAASGKVERIPKQLPAPLRRRLRRMLDPRPERRPAAPAMLAAGDAGDVRRRPPALAIVGGVAATALVATVAFVSTRDGGDDGSGVVPDRDGQGQAAEPGEDGASPTGSGGSGAPTTACDPASPEGCESAGSNVPGGDPDDGREIRAEVEGTIVPGDDVDTYRVPLGEDPGTTCPRQVDFELTLTGPQFYSLTLVLQEDGRVLDRQVSGTDPARVSFQPAGCGGQGVEVTVTADEPVDGEPYVLDGQSYLLTRIDSP